MERLPNNLITVSFVEVALLNGERSLVLSGI